MTDSSFLDENQYTESGISEYEKVFGQDFVSPGGGDTASRFLSELELPADSLVLDLCCGLGGASFLMAQKFGWRVEGLDLSQNMLRRAQSRCRELKLEDRVSFTHGDCLRMDRPSRYEAIYSRDSFLHIPPKDDLCQVLFRSLKPGGKLLFTDYCCGPKPWSDEFEAYVNLHRYHLVSVEQYEVELRNAGFQVLEAKDNSPEFLRTLECELEKIGSLTDLTNRAELEAGWKAKIARCKSGEQRWGKFCAIRPDF